MASWSHTTALHQEQTEIALHALPGNWIALQTSCSTVWATGMLHFNWSFFLSWQVWCQWWWKKPLDSFWFLITVFVVDKKGQKHHKNISNGIYCGLMKSSELCMRRRQNFNIYIYLCIWQALSCKVTNIAFKVHILYKNTCITWEWNPLHNKHHFFYCLSYKNASYELIIFPIMAGLTSLTLVSVYFCCRQKEPKTTI